MKKITLLLIAILISIGIPTFAETFKDLVGDVAVAPILPSNVIKVPYITWGGDMATFYANGGKKTAKGSLFDKKGLNLELYAGDDFVQQVKDYLSGKTPFLRGTMSMIAQASEVIGADARTKGVVILQLTWSNGDHMVARDNIKNIADLKGKKIAIQKNGPHIGMLNDILNTAQLSWDDVQIVWMDNVTGKKSPAELFKADPSISACFSITPDMISITGGLQNTGSGAEGTVKGSRVLVSTATLSHSIADVYVCRKDFYDANTPIVTKFVAAYLKGCEELIDLKKQYETKGSKPYIALLQMTQDIYGKEAIPTLEEDAHGLLSDCSFLGHVGNVKFFTDDSSLTGFKSIERTSLEVAKTIGQISIKNGFFKPTFDWNSPEFIGYLSKTEIVKGEHFNAEAVEKEIAGLNSGQLNDQTIMSFDINFEPNATDFSADAYGAEYSRIVEMAQKYGNAAIIVRGHSDPTKTLFDFINAGTAKGIIKRTGTTGNFKYFVNGTVLDLNSTKTIVSMIENGSFDGVKESDPRQTCQAALNLSKKRAEIVVSSIIAYAKTRGLDLQKNQIQPVGVGISEPIIPKPKNADEAKTNMRVEFRLIKVSPEAINNSDFSF